MKNFDFNNFMFGFFIIALFSITGLWITVILKNNEELKKQEQIEIRPQINDTIHDVIPIDTTIGMNGKPWPVKVISVRPNTNEFIEGDWVVTTENGLTYYTNEITHVGQIAFYLDNNGEIMKKYGENKLDPREW